jgi:hypothetical protein
LQLFPELLAVTLLNFSSIFKYSVVSSYAHLIYTNSTIRARQKKKIEK